MAEKQLAGDELSESIAGMSKNQLYDIMSQMKALIEQNQLQARDILVTNPPLTRALFQAQIMLGMVQPAEAIPSIPQTTSQTSQQSSKSSQQANVQATVTKPGQVGVQDQTSAPQAPNPPNKQRQNQSMMPTSSPSIPSLSVQTHPLPAHPIQSRQQPMEHLSAEATAMSLPQSPQVHNMHPTIHSATHQSSTQLPMPNSSTQSQQPLRTSGIPHMQLQPPLQPQQRSPLMPAFGHHIHSQMGPNEVFQHSVAPQMHHARPMYHSGHQHPGSVGPSFSQGHPTLPTHPLTPYQGGSPHIGMEINQMQPERGSPWMPGLRDTTGTQHLPGASQYGGGQIGPGTHPPHPQSLSPDMETALLQQVMSLTPEQINLLPAEQRNQVLQLQRMLRQ